MAKTTASFLWMTCLKHTMKYSLPVEVCAKYETVFDTANQAFVCANDIFLNPLFKLAQLPKGGQQTVSMKPSKSFSFRRNDTSFNTFLQNTENLHNGFTIDAQEICIEQTKNLFANTKRKHLNKPYLTFVSLITVPIIQSSMNMQSIRKDPVSDFLTSLAAKTKTRLISFIKIKQKTNMLIDLLHRATERKWDLIKRKEFIPTHLKFYNYGTYSNHRGQQRHPRNTNRYF